MRGRDAHRSGGGGAKLLPVARERGFEVVTTAEAVRRADVIFVALPDTKQPAAYEKDIEPNLTKGKTLLFSHGFSIHFKTIVPPKNVNVAMIAPKGPGHRLRAEFVAGAGSLDRVACGAAVAGATAADRRQSA